MPRPATPCPLQHHAIEVCQVKGCYQKVTTSTKVAHSLQVICLGSLSTVCFFPGTYILQCILSHSSFQPRLVVLNKGVSAHLTPAGLVVSSGTQPGMMVLSAAGELELKIFTQVFLISPFSQKSRFINQYQSLHNVFPNQMACKTCSRWHCPSGLKCQLAGQWRVMGLSNNKGH